MPSLAELQQGFASALRDPDRPVPNPVTGAGRRFNVYRNNVVVSLVDALKSTFPAVHRLVGEDYFTAAARAYVDAHPPRSPVLLLYGREFGDFLDGLPSAAGVPYLGDVARVEWARVNALHAADAVPAGIEALAGVPEEVMERVTVELHPSLSLISSRWPVVSLWTASTGAAKHVDVNMKQPEQALVVRPALKVGVHSPSPSTAVFMDALHRQQPLVDAADRAARTDGAFDLARALRFVFSVGAVTAVNATPQEES